MPFYTDLNYYRDKDPEKAAWISSNLLSLRQDLADQIITERRPGSLIIGSWNIRAFDGGLPRLDESYHYIAEIISAFDVCAIQEVKSNLEPLRRLKRLLGPNWDYFVTDVSDHEGGNYERMAFVFNKNKVLFKNLIGEIVIKKTALSSGNQIARSPFFAAFQAGWFRFTLVSSHIIFGKVTKAGLKKRAQEIEVISNSILERAIKEDQVYIFLGDMNIESRDDVVMQALVNSGLVLPEFPATNMKGNRFYDHIAFTDKGKKETKTWLLRYGAFDWRQAVFPHKDSSNQPPMQPAHVKRRNLEDVINYYEPIVARHREDNGKKRHKNFAASYKTWTTHEMSDHLPVWVELETDYSNDYLSRFVL